MNKHTSKTKSSWKKAIAGHPQALLHTVKIKLITSHTCKPQSFRCCYSEMTWAWQKRPRGRGVLTAPRRTTISLICCCLIGQGHCIRCVFVLRNNVRP
jgi:hypothetical protein